MFVSNKQLVNVASATTSFFLHIIAFHSVNLETTNIMAVHCYVYNL